jgi:chorismate mutase
MYPDNAVAQQVTPTALNKILWIESKNDMSTTQKMKKLRANIDVLDVDLLGKRMKVADEIGLVKEANVAVQKALEILGNDFRRREKKD